MFQTKNIVSKYPKFSTCFDEKQRVKILSDFPVMFELEHKFSYLNLLKN